MSFDLGGKFAVILAARGATHVNVHDVDEWIDFVVDERRVEAGIWDGHWVVTCTVGLLDADPARLKQVLAAIARGNGALPLDLSERAKFRESDCYLRVWASLPLAQVQTPLGVKPMEKLLDAARTVAGHAQATRILAAVGCD